MNFHRLKEKEKPKLKLAQSNKDEVDRKLGLPSSTSSSSLNAPIDTDVLYPLVAPLQDFPFPVINTASLNSSPTTNQSPRISHSPSLTNTNNNNNNEPRNALKLNVVNYYESQPLPPIPANLPNTLPSQINYPSTISQPTILPPASTTSSSSSSSPSLTASSKSTTATTPALPSHPPPTMTPPLVPPPPPSVLGTPLVPPPSALGTPLLSSPSLRGTQDDISMLTYLDLGSSASTVQMINSTGRLPRWLQKCTSLQYLVCKNLGLVVVDDWLSTKLTTLKVLRLNDNKIQVWPDHLARLVPYGNLKLVDLEGNPCLDNLFRKSVTFFAHYAQAAGNPLSDSVYKKLLKKQEKSGLNAGLTDDILAIALKNHSTNVSTNSSSSSNKKSPSTSAGGLFKKKSSRPIERSIQYHSEDDDMLTSLEPTVPTALKKKTSISSFIKPSSKQPSETPAAAAATAAAATAAAASKTPILQQGTFDKNFPNSPDKWANQRIEETELAKSNIIIQIICDIYELATKICIVNKSDYAGLAIFNDSTTLDNVLQPHHHHNRVNSLDVLQQYLDEVNGKQSTSNGSGSGSGGELNQIVASLSGLSIEVSHAVDILEEFVRQERRFIIYMEEFSDIYLDNNNKHAKKVFPAFRYLPHIYRLHSDIVLGLLEASVERLMQGQDDEEILDTLGSRMNSLIEQFTGCYLEYATTLEASKRRIRTLLKLKRIDGQQQATLYGATFNGYAQQQQHPDIEAAEWLRDCHKKSNHSLTSVLIYMELPYKRIQEYQVFFKQLAYRNKSMQLGFVNFNNLLQEMERRRPISERKRRWEDLLKLFKIKDTYGTFLCDISVVIHSKMTFDDVNSSNRFADIHYENKVKSLNNVINDISKPTQERSYEYFYLNK